MNCSTSEVGELAARERRRRVAAILAAGVVRVRRAAKCAGDREISDSSGQGLGRNQLLNTVETPYFLLIDDDHVVTEKSDVAGLVSRLHGYGDECDLLAAMSDGNGRPRCFTHDKANRTLYAGVGFHRRDGDVSFCDLVPNTFVAKTDPVREIGWAPFLKVHEHWEFFYRAWQRGLRVAITSEHRFDHRHLHNAAYNPLRSRSWYLRRGLKAHGLRRFLWAAPKEAK